MENQIKTILYENTGTQPTPGTSIKIYVRNEPVGAITNTHETNMLLRVQTRMKIIFSNR
jgi:hypothetical protein